MASSLLLLSINIFIYLEAIGKEIAFILLNGGNLMKKTRSTIVTLALTLALAITAVMSSATVALAAENEVAVATESDVTTEGTSVQPRFSVVYPISGSTSGYFTGLQSSNNARFGRIPAGRYHFSYSYDSQNMLGSIVIESGSERIEKNLIGDGGAHNSESFDLKGGTYTVTVRGIPQSYGIEKYYGYNLILE